MASLRIKIQHGLQAYYHVFTKVTQNLYGLKTEKEKEAFLVLLRILQKTFFIDFLAFQIMDNHFHLLLKTNPVETIDPEEAKARFLNIFPNGNFCTEKIPEYLAKWADLSYFMKTLNERFAVGYNRRNDKQGHFWAGRFKSTILADRESILHCMAYIDLNAVRAGMVENPEEHVYGSIGYVVERKNEGNLVNISEIGVQLDCLKKEKEEEVEKSPRGLEHLSSQERLIYTRYMAFVELKRKEGFLGKIAIFARQAILGMREHIEAILDRLNHRKRWNFRKLSFLGSAFTATC